jgi:oligopeptide transport system substrate-binding protein
MRLFTVLLLMIGFSASAATLRMALSEQPTTLDWTGAVNVASAPLVVNLNAGLFEPGENTGTLVPVLAESLTKSKDLKTYTFKIRKTAKWSDGRPVYAKDFVDAWQRVLLPNSSSIYYYYFYDILNAREFHERKIDRFEDVGIQAIDDLTLQVKLSKPQKTWESNTAFWPFFPVRKDLIEKHGNNWWHAGTLITSGPFILSSMETGKRAVLKRNPYFPKTGSNVDAIEADFSNDLDTISKKFKNGTYPFISQFNDSENTHSKQYRSYPLLRHHALIFNTIRFPSSNRNLRKAIIASIQRKELLGDFKGRFQIAESLIPPTMLKSKEIVSAEYNKDMATNFLENSGLIIDKSVKITMIASMSEPQLSVSKKIAQQVESTLKIPVNLLVLNNKELETNFNLGDYSMTVTSWTAKVQTPRDFLIPYSSHYFANNRARYSNEFYNEQVIQDELVRAQQILSVDDAVVHPLFFENAGYLMNEKKIKKLRFNHIGIPILKNIQLQ